MYRCYFSGEGAIPLSHFWDLSYFFCVSQLNNMAHARFHFVRDEYTINLCVA